MFQIRDADDGFSLEKQQDGVWKLGVHIADLSPWTADRLR
jgi:exoribonuclease R